MARLTHGLDALKLLSEDNAGIVEETRDLCGYVISYDNLFGT